MATLLLVLVVVLVIGGLAFGVISLLSGDDPGLVPAEPDGRARALPNDRSLHEDDLKEVRFDVGLRGYRMAQVDRMLRRTAYDLGYKDEMIAVLEAEVIALREGRREDADLLEKAREAASSPLPAAPAESDQDDPKGWAPAGEQVVDLDDQGGRSVEESVPLGGADESAVEDERPEADADQTSTDPDRMDDASDETDLPREGSLRRREPLPAPESGAPDSLAGSDGAAAVDVVDRPAHA